MIRRMSPKRRSQAVRQASELMMEAAAVQGPLPARLQAALVKHAHYLAALIKQGVFGDPSV